MGNAYLQEAFQALDVLNEEDFNLSAVDAFKDAKEFSEDDDKIDFTDIIDPEAETEDELKDSYIGNVILDCCVCHSKLYKNPEDVTIKEGEELVNIDEECPFCYSTDGYTIIGEVAPYGEKKEEEEVTEVEEEEEIEESLTEAYKIQRLSDDEIKNLKVGSIKYYNYWNNSDDPDDYTKVRVMKIIHPGNPDKAEVIIKDVSGENNDMTVNASALANVLYESLKEDAIPQQQQQEKKPQQRRNMNFQSGTINVDLNGDGVKRREKATAVKGRDGKVKYAEIDKDGVKYRLPVDSIGESFKSTRKLKEDLDRRVHKPAYIQRGKLMVIKDDVSFDEAIEKFYEEDRYYGGEYQGLATVTFDKPKIIHSTSFGGLNYFDKIVAIEILAFNPRYYSAGQDVAVSRLYNMMIEQLKQRYPEAEITFIGDPDMISGQWDDLYYPDDEEIGESFRKRKGIKEHFEKVEIETDKDRMEMTSDENGKVVVTTEPKEAEEEVIVPVSDEIQSEINPVKEPVEDEEEIDVTEFSEEDFDNLGESYLKKVYENVNSFKVSKVMTAKNKLVVEGIIGFNSGKQKKTSFVFESKDIDKKGRLRFIGENLQLSRGKKSFTLVGSINNGKFISESLNYNYRQKNADGKSTRVYGTVRK